MATSAHMSHEVVPDALPYIDQGYDEPGIREMVNQLIEEETRRYRPTKNYLDFLPTPNYGAFETPVMKTEFERIANRQPMEVLSMKRYELPQPTANQKTDISAWTECVNNSMAQLEHQATRIHNLDLLGEFGGDSWRLHNATLQQMLEYQQKKHGDLKKSIQEINWERKTEQSKAGEDLQRLETSWIELVSKNYEIERACIELEVEIENLKRQRKVQEIEEPEMEKKRRKTEEDEEKHVETIENEEAEEEEKVETVETDEKRIQRSPEGGEEPMDEEDEDEAETENPS